MDDTFGRHVIAELSKCKNILEYDDETKLKALLIECASVANATVLSVSTHKFEPQGISGLVYLAESHISIHAWPQKEYVAMDCYTCGENTYPFRAITNFIERIDCKLAYYHNIERGISDIDDKQSFILNIGMLRNSIVN